MEKKNKDNGYRAQVVKTIEFAGRLEMKVFVWRHFEATICCQTYGFVGICEWIPSRCFAPILEHSPTGKNTF